MNDRDLAWAAGVIDGEGCICISRRRSGLHQFAVTVANTDARIPQRLAELFGGTITTRQPQKVRHNTAWCWTAYQAAAAATLRLIRPFLVSKGEQADIALDFMATMRKGRRFAEPLPEGVAADREAMRLRLKALKGRKVA